MFQIKQLKEPLRMWGEILAPLQNISNEWGEKKKTLNCSQHPDAPLLLHLHRRPKSNFYGQHVWQK